MARSLLLKNIFFLSCLSLLSACSTSDALGTGVSSVGYLTAPGYAAVQERSFGSAVDDATIHGKVSAALMSSDSKEMYRGIGIEVSEGRVLLTGQVKNPSSAENAVKAAWAVQHVREVINEIQVTGRSGPSVYALDSTTTSQIKGRVLAERGVASMNYSIETVNGVVYVFGVASGQDELDKVLNIASRTSGVRKVVSHVRVPGKPSDTVPTTPPPTIAPEA